MGSSLWMGSEGKACHPASNRSHLPFSLPGSGTREFLYLTHPSPGTPSLCLIQALGRDMVEDAWGWGAPGGNRSAMEEPQVGGPVLTLSLCSWGSWWVLPRGLRAGTEPTSSCSGPPPALVATLHWPASVPGKCCDLLEPHLAGSLRTVRSSLYPQP
jgi:hypothetical protein